MDLLDNINASRNQEFEQLMKQMHNSLNLDDDLTEQEPSKQLKMSYDSIHE
jgi:uncharacterized protein YdbL (DUF1318 family)